eukprot:494761-Rhodomonas_salina.1
MKSIRSAYSPGIAFVYRSVNRAMPSSESISTVPDNVAQEESEVPSEAPAQLKPLGHTMEARTRLITVFTSLSYKSTTLTLGWSSKISPCVSKLGWVANRKLET